MNSDNNKIIDDFLLDKLDNNEKQDFENELKINPSLQKDLSFEKDINNAIIQDDIELFKQKVISVRQNMKEKEPIKRSLFIGTKQTWLLIAASVLVLFATLSLLYHLNNNGHTNLELYAMYFEPYQSDIIERSGGIENSMLVPAVEAYNKGDFVTASKIFNSITINEPDNIVARFYGGISNMQIDNYPKAIASFQYIISNNKFLFKEQAQWYLALAILKTDNNSDLDKVIELLTKLRDNNGDCSKDAGNLLVEIENHTSN